MQKELYSYEGEMNNGVLNSILFAMENKMKEMGERPPAIKKVNSIIIECCQNLIHHPDKPPVDTPEYFPSVSITQVEGGLYIQTRNLVLRNKADTLKNYIDKINSLSTEALKEYFQSVLTNGQIGSHGGGGLGLLNIIRKAKDTQLHYSFEPANEEEFFFKLAFTI